MIKLLSPIAWEDRSGQSSFRFLYFSNKQRRDSDDIALQPTREFTSLNFIFSISAFGDSSFADIYAKNLSQNEAIIARKY